MKIESSVIVEKIPGGAAEAQKTVNLLVEGSNPSLGAKKKGSLKQIQNRDKIKISEIIKAGYKPYVIKDMGKYNPAFVKEEYEKFKSQVREEVISSGS